MHILRRVFAVPVLFAIAAAVHGLQQRCGSRQDHQAPGGFVIGEGSTKERAIYDAGTRSAQQVGISVPPCANCPGTNEPCDGGRYYQWDNYQVGDPVWDPVLKVYLVTVTWDCCDVNQTCTSCP